MIGDTYIIQGLSDILNKENIRSDIDVGEIERKMISSGAMSRPDVVASDRFDQEINDVVRKLGISLDVDSTQSSADTIGAGNINSRYNAILSDVSDANSTSSANNTTNTYEKYEKYHIDFEDEPDDELETEDTVFARKTQEEQRRAQIRNVVGDDNASLQNFSLENEREEDYKCEMLAEIEYIIDGLKEEGVDVSRIPRVNDNNDAAAIEKVLKVLRHKMDHARYCTFAEEFLLSGAHGLEYLFDGKNTWFGRWRPNLTGWNVHVKRKLRRMRTDTGKIVSHVMSDYDIGPFMRVCLELIPSMFLFSNEKSKQNNLSAVMLDNDMIESRNALDDI